MGAIYDPDCLRALYQNWSERMAATPDMGLDDMRSMFDDWHQATGEPENVTYAEDQVGGVGGIWCVPVNDPGERVILYTHGGGFVTGSASSHRKLGGHLAAALGARAFVIDYRRAPEHAFPAQLDDGVAVYRALVAAGTAPENIITAGDSAGGNLAISIPLKLRADGDQLPGAVVALSPWVDMEHVGATLETNAATDALVQKAIVQGMSAMFLGEGGDPADPLANPLHADFAGFPRLYLDAGTHETLQDNAERIHALASAAGVDSTLNVVEGQQHVFPFMAGRSKVADDEIAAIAAWYAKGSS